MLSGSRWSVVGFASAFVLVALSLYVYWPVGIAVGLLVGIGLLALIQRRLLAEERAEYLDGHAEVEDVLGALLTN